MNGYLSLFAFSAILIASIGIAPAFGQIDNTIIVSTDQSSYLVGEKVLITGSVGVVFPSFPLTVMVISPIGNIVSIDQIMVGDDGTFSTEIITGGSLMAAAGEYTIIINYSSFKESIIFEFEGIPNTITGTLAVDGSTEVIKYEITGGKISSITPDVKSNSLILSIEATRDGSAILIIPRSILDSVENGIDAEIFINADNKEINFDEEITSKDRTITLSFPVGTETIEIIGTFVIPEFGTIAAMILAVAIISIIAISAKSRLSIMSNTRINIHE